MIVAELHLVSLFRFGCWNISVFARQLLSDEYISELIEKLWVLYWHCDKDCEVQSWIQRQMAQSAFDGILRSHLHCI